MKYYWQGVHKNVELIKAETYQGYDGYEPKELMGRPFEIICLVHPDESNHLLDNDENTRFWVIRFDDGRLHWAIQAEIFING